MLMQYYTSCLSSSPSRSRMRAAREPVALEKVWSSRLSCSPPRSIGEQISAWRQLSALTPCPAGHAPRSGQEAADSPRKVRLALVRLSVALSSLSRSTCEL